MNNIVNVSLWGQRVGAVLWTGEVAAFQYEPDFCKTGLELAPLTMPLNPTRVYSFPNLGTDTFHRLPSMLADALPDEFGMRVWAKYLHARGHELEDAGPIEKLSLMGSRAMGALEFEPDRAKGHSMAQSSPLPIDEIWQMAKGIMEEKRSLTDTLTPGESQNLLRFCGSPGGARAKALIAVNESGIVKSGQVAVGEGFTHWILKFDGLDASGGHIRQKIGESRVELAYHFMAKAAQIEMMPCQTLKHADSEMGLVRHHFMTQRFDRQGDEKIHVQTLCGMAQMDYGSTGNTYEGAFGVMEMLGLGHLQREQLFRRMVFNVVANVTDDHTKNLGFIMNKQGKWSLAPAYDLTPGGVGASHRLRLNGKNNGLCTDDLVKVAAAAGIKTSPAKSIIQEVVGVVSNWEKYAAQAHVEDERIEETNRKIFSAGMVPRPSPMFD